MAAAPARAACADRANAFKSDLSHSPEVMRAGGAPAQAATARPLAPSAARRPAQRLAQRLTQRLARRQAHRAAQARPLRRQRHTRTGRTAAPPRRPTPSGRPARQVRAAARRLLRPRAPPRSQPLSPVPPGAGAACRPPRRPGQSRPALSRLSEPSAFRIRASARAARQASGGRNQAPARFAARSLPSFAAPLARAVRECWPRPLSLPGQPEGREAE